MTKAASDEWNATNRRGRLLTYRTGRVRIDNKPAVDLPAALPAQLERAFAEMEKGDALYAKQAGNKYIVPPKDAAELERAKRSLARSRARRTATSEFGIASIEADNCLDLGIALYDAPESWKASRANFWGTVETMLWLIGAMPGFVLTPAGQAMVNQVGQAEIEYQESQLAMQSIQSEFGLNHCFGPYY